MEVINYPGYLIYEDGRVYSKKKCRGIEGLFLKQRLSNEYWSVEVCKNGKSKLLRIHRLIGLHYIPNPENKSEVHHIDGNKQNNKLNNLMWVTHQENMNGFKKKYISNTSGYKNIFYDKINNKWKFKRTENKKVIQKYFKTKQEAIIYKFIFIKFLRKFHHLQLI